jgi:hypothetical protein
MLLGSGTDGLFVGSEDGMPVGRALGVMFGPLEGCALGHPDPVQAPISAPAATVMSPRALIVPVLAFAPTVMAPSASRSPHSALSPTVMAPVAVMLPIEKEFAARVIAPLTNQ